MERLGDSHGKYFTASVHWREQCGDESVIQHAL